jgi:hypothetical protein
MVYGIVRVVLANAYVKCYALTLQTRLLAKRIPHGSVLGTGAHAWDRDEQMIHSERDHTY